MRQPRKRAATATAKAEVDCDDEPVVKKGRGRPKKNAEEAAPAVEPNVKKGRKTKKDTAETNGDVADAEASTSQAASSSKGKANKKKKTEEKEAMPAAKPPGGKGKSKQKKGSGKENVDSSNVPKEKKQIKSGGVIFFFLFQNLTKGKCTTSCSHFQLEQSLSEIACRLEVFFPTCIKIVYSFDSYKVY